MVSKLKCYSISAHGAKQIEAKKPLQDSSGRLDEAGDFIAIAVSDGHGGDKYFRSDQGAEFAVAVALDCVKACFDEQVFVDAFTADESTDTDRKKRIAQLEESIVWRWNEAVRQALEEHPFEAEELSALEADVQDEMRDESSDSRARAYGATLLVAVVGEGFWFGMHIGDGTFVVKQDGEYSQPIPLDERCVGPYTTSICAKDAIRYFHHAWGFDVPDAILIASDGVDESFSSIEGLYGFYDTVIQSSLEDWEGNITELEAYLPQLSAKGSRDDISLAWIINTGSTNSTSEEG